MNSLSIITTRVEQAIGTPPTTPREESFRPLHPPPYDDSELQNADPESREDPASDRKSSDAPDANEKPRIRASSRVRTKSSMGSKIYLRVISPCYGALRWVVMRVVAPVTWIVSGVIDSRGAFAPLLPFRRISALLFNSPGKDGLKSEIAYQEIRAHAGGDGSLTDDDSEVLDIVNTPVRRRRGTNDSQTSEEGAHKQTIKIRLQHADLRPKSKTPVKSPTSPVPNLRLTKYPRAAGPPRPLLPRNPAPKTLILDLDETLIHSLSKGGRMSSGHMVEVKLEKQHAILYYVHKRPFCDEFLRKVCRWYKLVIFTASVQEYADPVIDWLEQDRKYFNGRYYRQHCTMRNGAYIKDLSVVEPDLSKVAIIDNSPMSYVFHEDNAVPIEGWINDPTDIDLLHLLPLLQALQYVPDVRAFLALRMGEVCSR